LSLVAAGLLLAAPLCADSDRPLSDPTRPSGWHRTETAPTSSAQPALNALKLQGTFSRAGERSALISGQRVSVGDLVSGAEVLEIDNNRVMLRIDGRTVELASLVAEVKSPVKNTGERK
jgi:Tfp pilus assembly protein PilP